MSSYFDEVARELVNVRQMVEGGAVKLIYSHYGEFFQENREEVVGGYAVLALAILLSSGYRKWMRGGGFFFPVVVF